MVRAVYRVAEKRDVLAMARIRAAEWETQAYWQRRIAGYMDLEVHPRQALKPRVVYVAEQQSEVVAFAAGHLTRRFDCQGELEWINVATEARGCGLADELLRRVAGWFISQGAKRICVDVVPENTVARRFYARHGAREFRSSWLLWDDIGVVCDR